MINFDTIRMGDDMELFVYAILYAFVGWIIEVTYYIYKTKSFVNRGFLNGPFVPIYGLSLVSLHMVISWLFDISQTINLAIVISVFVLIIVIGTLLELIGGIILFNLFETRWWDYSDQPLNYKGYICLPFSLIWGFLGTGGYFFIHVPFIMPFVNSLNATTLRYFTYGMSLILLIDLIFTVYSLWNFKLLIDEFSQVTGKLYSSTQKMRDKLPKPLTQSLDMIKRNERLKNIYSRFNRAKDTVSDLKDKVLFNHYTRLEKLLTTIQNNRLYKAFPDLKIFKRKKEDSNE